jgi:hypothetical protein
MFTKMKSVLRDYFLPQYPNDFIYYMHEHGMSSYYDPTETDILYDELDTLYDKPLPQKP